MKRPLAIWCAVFVACSTAVGFLPVAAALVCLAAGLAALAVLLWFWRRAGLSRRAKLAVLILTAVCAALVPGTARAVRIQHQRLQLQGERTDICFAVRAVQPLNGGGIKADILVYSVGAQTVRLRAEAYFSEFVQTGDEYCCESGEIEFSSNGTARFTSDGSLVCSGRRYLLLRRFSEFRQSISTALQGGLGADEGALAAAMLSGDRSGIGTRLQSELQRSGLSHIVVVSGLHISLMIYFANKLLGALFKGMRRKAAVLNVFSVLTAVFLVFAAGFTPSVIRAALAAVLANIAALSSRRADGLTSLAFAGAVIALFDPFALQSASFWLSFSCCFGLLVLLPAVLKTLLPELSREKRARKLLRRILSVLLLPVCASVATLPAACVFGISVSLLSPIANIPVIWLAPVCMLLSVLVALLFWMPGLSGVCAAVASVAKVPFGIVLSISRAVSRISFASVDTSGALFKTALAFAFVLFAVCLLLWGKRLGSIKLLGACLLVLAAIFGINGAVLSRAESFTVVGSRCLSVCLQDGSVLYCGSSAYDLRLLYEQSLYRSGGEFALAVNSNTRAQAAMTELYSHAELLPLESASEQEEYQLIQTRLGEFLLISLGGQRLGMGMKCESTSVLFVFDPRVLQLASNTDGVNVWCCALPDGGEYGILDIVPAQGSRAADTQVRRVYIFPNGRIFVVGEWSITTRKP